MKLDNRSHVGVVELKKLNWLPTKERVYQCICVSIFKFFNGMSPEYILEVFHPSYRRHNTQASMFMLDVPFRKCCSSQKTLSYLGAGTWNMLPAQIKLHRSVNTFKHDIFRQTSKDTTDDMFIYYWLKQPPTYIHFHILCYSWCICVPLFIVFPKGP